MKFSRVVSLLKLESQCRTISWKSMGDVLRTFPLSFSSVMYAHYCASPETNEVLWRKSFWKLAGRRRNRIFVKRFVKCNRIAWKNATWYSAWRDGSEKSNYRVHTRGFATDNQKCERNDNWNEKVLGCSGNSVRFPKWRIHTLIKCLYTLNVQILKFEF